MKIDEDLLILFLKSIKEKYGDDFLNYNFSMLKRRIRIHSIKLYIDNFNRYTQSVLNSSEIFDEMFTHFSINITEFFREPEQLKNFTEHIIPYLKTFPYLKIWCAGCSTGESPYTLSILLEEVGLLDKCQIYATDFNNQVLSRAKNGLYDIENLTEVSQRYISSGGKKKFEKYFIKKGKYYQIKKRIKEKILFFNHNLVTDGLINTFQLIICKNVVIYFNQELKNITINKFKQSLVYNGFLILGNSEYLPQSLEKDFKLYIKKSKVYQKKC